jgi:hypothetical protein
MKNAEKFVDRTKKTEIAITEEQENNKNPEEMKNNDESDYK